MQYTKDFPPQIGDVCWLDEQNGHKEYSRCKVVGILGKKRVVIETNRGSTLGVNIDRLSFIGVSFWQSIKNLFSNG